MSRLWPSLSFEVFAAVSFAGLAWSLLYLPVGSAVWTGTGAATTAAIGMIWLGEAISLLKIVSVLLVAAGIVGLNLAGCGH